MQSFRIGMRYRKLSVSTCVDRLQNADYAVELVGGVYEKDFTGRAAWSVSAL